MADDNQTQDAVTTPVAEIPVQAPEPVPAPIESESSQPNGSTPIDLPFEATESPISDVPPIPVESQNGGVNEPQSEAVSTSFVQPAYAPAPLNSSTLQTQPLAQQDEHGFIKSLLIKAQAKIQFNKQKKLNKIIQLAQNKKTITNDDVQKFLHVSDATATRYLVKLVEQGRLSRVGSPRDSKYQFLR